MAGTIFFRERSKVEEGDKKPRFTIVAVAGADVKFKAKHMRRNELEQVAKAIGAELVELQVEDKGHKLADAD
jgi:hypothetical protein